MLDGMAGLVLTGGEDVDAGALRRGAASRARRRARRPRRVRDRARRAPRAARGLPTLAICRGVQVDERRARRHARAGHSERAAGRARARDGAGARRAHARACASTPARGSRTRSAPTRDQRQLDASPVGRARRRRPASRSAHAPRRRDRGRRVDRRRLVDGRRAVASRRSSRHAPSRGTARCSPRSPTPRAAPRALSCSRRQRASLVTCRISRSGEYVGKEQRVAHVVQRRAQQAEALGRGRVQRRQPVLLGEAVVGRELEAAAAHLLVVVEVGPAAPPTPLLDVVREQIPLSHSA